MWSVTNWSRGELQDASIFSNLSDALDFSYKMLSNAPEFRRAARANGYNPPHYEFTELIEALAIALQEIEVRFSLQKAANALVASNGKMVVKIDYSEETKTASAIVYQSDQLNSKFDKLLNALSYFYCRFPPTSSMA